MFAVLLAALAGLSTAEAHIALWDKAMFGFNYPYQSNDPDNNNYNNNDPVHPLREFDAFTTDQWFAHGYKGYPPKAGDFMTLPAGGTYSGEHACNRGETSMGDPIDTSAKSQFACRGGEGALHTVNRYNQTMDPQWLGGTALAIAYTSDVNSVQPNDFTVISVNHQSVWFREVDYQIPAALPACPSGGCLCTWNWIHQANHGEGYPFEMYNILYRCQVTGASSTAPVKRGAIPQLCSSNPSQCVSGPKTPMYIYQADGNNIANGHLDDPPLYQDSWGFKDGAQNDIFQAAATPAPTTYVKNPWAIPTATTGTYTQPTPTATALPSTWVPLGCMVDSPTSRTLPNGGYQSTQSLSWASCVNFCSESGYVYAGVEYGQECWCSNQANLVSANATECNSHCTGDPWAMCGGGYRMNVFLNTYVPPAGGDPVTTPTGTPTFASGAPTPFPTASLPSGWKSLGCNVDSSNTRALNRGSTTSQNYTISSCIQNCASQGWPYAGMEYGQECWCGDKVNLNVVGDEACNTPCGGDSKTSCGGSWRINLYQNVGGSSPSSTPTPKPSSSTSTSTSTSKTPSSTSKTSPTSSSTSKTSTTSSTSKTTNPSASPSPAAFVSVGCSVDQTSPRVLSGYTVTVAAMTPSWCISTCTSKGYSFAGVEYGNQCYCGNSVNFNATTDGCNMPCGGDSKSICGGRWRMNVYTNDQKAIASISAAASTASSTTSTSSSTSSSTTTSTTSTTTSKISSTTPAGTGVTVTVTATVTVTNCNNPNTTTKTTNKRRILFEPAK